MSERAYFRLGALSAGIAVALGAMGAHALPGMLEAQEVDAQRISDRVEWLEVGVRYQMYHALALMTLAGLKCLLPSLRIQGAAIAFIAGTLMFSVSLYLMAFADMPVHMVVPIGGVSYMVGWLLLVIHGIPAARTS